MGIDHHSKTFKNYTLCSLLYLFSVLLIRKESDEIFRFFSFPIVIIYCLIYNSPLYEDNIFIMVVVITNIVIADNNNIPRFYNLEKNNNDLLF